MDKLNTQTPQDPDQVRETVRAHYAMVAESVSSCCAPGSAPMKDSADVVSAQLGYSEDELEAAPKGANLGLGCGNPQAIANLKAGETAVDLGSGAGFDSFLAARQVGPTGRVIGVDMTAEMIAKARHNAQTVGAENVEFRLGEIERLPIADQTADVILSNCVINLSPHKAEVFKEAFRVLKPGGRLAISDVVMTAPIPVEMQEQALALCGCVAGAASVAQVEGFLKEAGFGKLKVTVKEDSQKFIKEWFPGSGAENYVASANIEAIKEDPQAPREPECCVA